MWNSEQSQQLVLGMIIVLKNNYLFFLLSLWWEKLLSYYFPDLWEKELLWSNIEHSINCAKCREVKTHLEIPLTCQTCICTYLRLALSSFPLTFPLCSSGFQYFLEITVKFLLSFSLSLGFFSWIKNEAICGTLSVLQQFEAFPFTSFINYFSSYSML